MTEEEQKLMQQYGITVEQKSVFSYQGYKYGQLKDALSYARANADKANKPPGSGS